MKNIPIFILNKDRLIPLRDQVEALRQRGYNNITVIDNKSTYPPLLKWYEMSGIDVYFNRTDRTCNGSLFYLAFEFGVEKFLKPMTEGPYVFNDSDVVPTEKCPVDFIDHMLEIRNRLHCHKVGLGLKIDDLPDYFYQKPKVMQVESDYWRNLVETHPIPLYLAPVDTTFAVYAPGSPPVWGGVTQKRESKWVAGPCYRTGGAYMGRHIPWYYDYNNLPEDEKYYIMHLEAGKGPVWSFQAKETVK